MNGINTSDRVFRKTFSRVVMLLIAAMIFMFLTLVFREIYLGIFEGINLKFAKELFRNYLVFLTVWAGSRLVFLLINRIIPWRKHPAPAIFIQLIILTVYSYGALLVYAMFFEGVIDTNIGTRERHFTLALAFFVLNVFINFILELQKMLIDWKTSVEEKALLKKEIIQARLNVLQQQVNPHFLFNTLNTLASLVHKDAEESDYFIRQMAKVYRYVLDSHEKDLVTLQEELKFIESFIYLLKIRYKEALQIKQNIPLDNGDKIIPVSLQMLIENAVKHNVTSQKKKLNIELYIEDNYVVVKNNLQLRGSSDNSLGLGLNNLRNRYSALIQKEVLTKKTDEFFYVKLPLIKN